MIKLRTGWVPLGDPGAVEKKDVDGNVLYVCRHKRGVDRVMFVRLKQYTGYKFTCMTCGAEWVETFEGREKR